MEGSGNVQGLATGNLFTLENSERRDQDQEYLLIDARHHLSLDGYRSGDGGGEMSMNCSLQCIPASQQFRAPRLTPKPTISGPQTAIVVGPSGEEIWTDKLGRVKLQFHWDRYGKSDENSSCWVRVSQVWAGAGWGAMYIPRIGQEVIVECLEGDPDQPIITGRIYNGDNAVPYDLPADQTQSGIKSRSTKGGQSKNFNEIRMEDKKGEEEIYIHAEKDMNVVVENDSSLKIGFGKEDKGDYTVEVKNDRTTTIDSGDDKLLVKKGNREVEVSKGNYEVEVSEGNYDVEVSKGDYDVEVSKGNHKMKVGAGTSTIEAAKSITLKVGGNSIVIDQKGVTIKGMKVAIDGKTTAEMKGGVSATVSGGAKAELKGPMVDVKGDAMVKIQGAITMIN